MNIPDEVIEREIGHSLDVCEYPEDVKRDFTAGATWARKEALREAVEACVRSKQTGYVSHFAQHDWAAGRDDAVAAVRALAKGVD